MADVLKLIRYADVAALGSLPLASAPKPAAAMDILDTLDAVDVNAAVLNAAYAGVREISSQAAHAVAFVRGYLWGLTAAEKRAATTQNAQNALNRDFGQAGKWSVKWRPGTDGLLFTSSRGSVDPTTGLPIRETFEYATYAPYGSFYKYQLGKDSDDSELRFDPKLHPQQLSLTPADWSAIATIRVKIAEMYKNGGAEFPRIPGQKGSVRHDLNNGGLNRDDIGLVAQRLSTASVHWFGTQPTTIAPSGNFTQACFNRNEPLPIGGRTQFCLVLGKTPEDWTAQHFPETSSIGLDASGGKTYINRNIEPLKIGDPEEIKFSNTPVNPRLGHMSLIDYARGLRRTFASAVP